MARLFYGAGDWTFGWFRLNMFGAWTGLKWLNGYGISWKDTRKHRMLFSERELGHGLKIGPYRVHLLKSDGPWEE